MCRTGDRARWRADGQVEFLGRADNQVKIRGFRVEPGEIEEVLGEHPALAQAAVAARQRAEGDLRLVAYVVGKAGAVPDAAEMKQFLARRVPDYMVPSAFVTVSALPTTASGKVDRKALPAPDWSSASLPSEFVAPRSEAEQQLAAIWSEVLALDRIGVNDNFFELGGNSLLSLRLISRVRATFSVDLPLIALFTAPTVAELAMAVEKMRSESRPEATRSAGRPVSDGPVDWDAEVDLDPAIRVTTEFPARKKLETSPPSSSLRKLRSLAPCEQPDRPDRCSSFMGWAGTSPPSCRWRGDCPTAGRCMDFRRKGWIPARNRTIGSKRWRPRMPGRSGLFNPRDRTCLEAGRWAA